MANIADFLFACLFFYVFEQSRLVIDGHFMEGVVPELPIEAGIKVAVVLAVHVAPGVVYPHVVSLVY